MSDYQRLISYVYMYQGREKGKNSGFVKLESRGGQCKIGISLKGINTGTADLEVFLFSKQDEVPLGKIYIRNGQGELRIVTDQENLVGSGVSLSMVGGLKVRSTVEQNIYYATIWDDAVADISVIPTSVENNQLKASTAPLTAPERDDEKVSSEGKNNAGNMRQEILQKTADQEVDENHSNQIVTFKDTQEDTDIENALKGQDCQECDVCDECSGSKEEASIEEMEDQQRMADFKESGIGEEFSNIRRPLFGYHWEQGFSERTRINRTQRRLQMPETSEERLRPFNNQEDSLRPIDESENRTYIEETENYQEQKRRTVAWRDDDSVQQIHTNQETEQQELFEGIITGQNEASIGLVKEEEQKPQYQPEVREGRTVNNVTREMPLENLWEDLRRRFPKAAPFGIDLEHEILTIQPQDIGLLPRDTWIFGNNSFLLHGYYQHRYLVLVKIVDDQEKYFLGVPGIYHNNERFMANMFGFTNFYLAKKQPENVNHFGFWCTEVKL